MMRSLLFEGGMTMKALKKLVIATVLLVLCVMALAGCGNKVADTSNDTSNGT